MAGTTAFQLIVILLQVFCLKLEKMSKINSLVGYTKWYFVLNLLISGFSMAIYLTSVIDTDVAVYTYTVPQDFRHLSVRCENSAHLRVECAEYLLGKEL